MPFVPLVWPKPQPQTPNPPSPLVLSAQCMLPEVVARRGCVCKPLHFFGQQAPRFPLVRFRYPFFLPLLSRTPITPQLRALTCPTCAQAIAMRWEAPGAAQRPWFDEPAVFRVCRKEGGHHEGRRRATCSGSCGRREEVVCSFDCMPLSSRPLSPAPNHSFPSTRLFPPS